MVLRKLRRNQPEERPKRNDVHTLISQSLHTRVKLLAISLGLPAYVLYEHFTATGLRQMSVILDDPVVREELVQHLTSDHLLKDDFDGRVWKSTESRRVQRALLLLHLFEQGRVKLRRSGEST